MPFFDRTFYEILGSQAVSLLIGLLAGALLAFYTDRLLMLPGILILLPGFLEMRGNISGSLSSRISSGLFLKIIKPGNEAGRIVKGNLVASFTLAFAVSSFLGILAFAFTYLATGAALPMLIAVPVIAGIIANLIEIPLAIFFTFYLFRKGHDPNNIMGPFLTSTGDVTSIFSLMIVMAII